MSPTTESPAPPIDLERLAEDTVAEALSHEDPQRLLQWLQTQLPRYAQPDALPPMDEPGPGRAMAMVLGQAIWNALPLPGNDFRPRPLPKPKATEPCICGSGRRFKQCCGPFWQALPLDTEFAWPLVITHIGPKAALQAYTRGRIPAQAMLDAAELFQDRHEKPTKAVKLLEALLDPVPKRPDAVHGEALDRLCNLYDQLQYPRKKQRLLDKLAGLSKPSPLRAAVYRRWAMISMDRGDAERAWQHFRQAQRDDPEALDLGPLEVQLLVAETRFQQAAERADYWVRQWQRQGVEDDDPMLAFMRRISTDPLTAMGELSAQAGDGSTARLLHWLRENAERPLPQYTLDEPQAIDLGSDDPDADLQHMLRGMGLPDDQIGPAIEQLKQQLEAGPPEDAEDDFPEGDPNESADTRMLTPPPAIARLEDEWHRVFPAGKPFSTQDRPFDQTDPWARAERWSKWLERHPAAFDSVDILDDLATALLCHEEAYTPWQTHTLLLPLLQRVQAIVEQALAGQPAPHLEWGVAGNRPALRSLARKVNAELQLNRPETAFAQAERLLQLNPNDNHGFRQLLIDHYLHAGDDEAALALAERYPEDGSPDFLFGRALAYYRLGRSEAAEQALHQAVELQPDTADSLRRKQVRRPPMADGFITLGGESEDWEYRQAMRPVWEKTPGALDWLQRAVERQRQQG